MDVGVTIRGNDWAYLAIVYDEERMVCILEAVKRVCEGIRTGNPAVRSPSITLETGSVE